MLSLPPFTFIMSNHETRQLACDVAELLQQDSDMILIEDFLAPIHDALAAMFELDWKNDMGLPKNVNRLLLPALKESTEGDMIKNLERWFTEQFGPRELGIMGVRRALENREIADYSMVFRDATPEYTTAFFLATTIAKRDMLFIHLKGQTSIPAPAQNIFIVPGHSPEQIVQQIRIIL